MREVEETEGAGLLVLLPPESVLAAGSAEQDARTISAEQASNTLGPFLVEIPEMCFDPFRSVFSIVDPNHISCVRIKGFG